MKERTIIGIIVALLAAILAVVFAGTDALFALASIFFFGICIAYAEWCERL
jgi:uncharacterized membrane protein YccC